MSETFSILSGLFTRAADRRAEASALRLAVRQSAGSLLLACGDIISLELALVLVTSVIGRLVAEGGGDGVFDPIVSTVIALTVLISNGCLGLYETAGRSSVERFRLRVWGTLILPWLAVAIMALFETINHQRVVAGLILTTLLWLPLALIAEALVVRLLIAWSAWGMRALLVGDSRAIAPLAQFLLAHPEMGLKPVGFCGSTLDGGDQNPVARLGSSSDAEHMADAAEIAIVALSPDVKSLELARLPFRRIVVLPETTGLPSLWLRSRALGSGPALEFHNPLQMPANRRAKRLLDLVIAVPLLILSLPVIAVLAVAIQLVSPGPVFYVQRRVGRNGVPLATLKLRSMYIDAEQRLEGLLAQDSKARAEWEKCVKLSHDPRVLPIIGNFIRKTSLDELPQLWNVVRGDMSMVGPRPFPSYHLDRFDADFRALRVSVRPGLTGLWQVSERSNADLRQQQMLDTFYIRNWSLWFDLYIALLTLPAILSARGAR
ncbi:MAG: exopolysaccharide biosynthesis polyprenyl glycosylphosphotransferase [Acetobacteraceae bacterium]